VSRVFTHNSDVLRYLDALCLRPGSALRVLDRAPFNGPLRLAVRLEEAEEREIAIGTEIASYIHVAVDDGWPA
jgi:DtxR family Mn-dependent transcriptional regulator